MVVKAHELKAGDAILGYWSGLVIAEIEYQPEQVIIELEDGTFKALKNDWDVTIKERETV